MGAARPGFYRPCCVVLHRPRYILRHWLEVLIIALPLLRGLRLLRLASLRSAEPARRERPPRQGRHLRHRRSIAAGVLRRVGPTRRRAPQPRCERHRLRRRDVVGRHHHDDVGYGDEYPPGPGRLVATVLMVAGIALLGSVTATLASWLVDQVRCGGGARGVRPTD